MLWSQNIEKNFIYSSWKTWLHMKGCTWLNHFQKIQQAQESRYNRNFTAASQRSGIEGLRCSERLYMCKDIHFQVKPPWCKWRWLTWIQSLALTTLTLTLTIKDHGCSSIVCHNAFVVKWQDELFKAPYWYSWQMWGNWRVLTFTGQAEQIMRRW